MDGTENEIIKCPCCGANLNSFVSSCRFCGYELRKVKATDSLSELSRMLLSVNDEPGAEQKKADIIKSYPIPNAFEDILDFMIMAASNIDPMAYDTSNRADLTEDGKKRILLSNAWESKYIQAAGKARIMFPQDPRLIQVERMYKEKMAEVKKYKSKVVKILIGCGIVVLVSIGILVAMKCMGLVQ